MSSLRVRFTMIRHVLIAALLCFPAAGVVRAQDAQSPVSPAQAPAYLVLVEGDATLERDGESIPATVNMPFVPGDRARTGNGRVQIAFPDGTAIEVGEGSIVECV